MEEKRVVEAETVLDPSLHTQAELAEIMVSELVARGIKADDLQADLDAHTTPGSEAGQPYHMLITNDDEGSNETVSDILDSCEARLFEAGYAVTTDIDAWLIYPNGTTFDDDGEPVAA